jgi:hypothetical protein
MGTFNSRRSHFFSGALDRSNQSDVRNLLRTHTLEKLLRSMCPTRFPA